MAWAHDAEVSPVERGNFWLVETFRDRQHGCIHEVDASVGVPLKHIRYTAVVLWRQYLHPKCSAVYVPQKSSDPSDMHAASEPIVHLTEDWCGNDNSLAGGLK